MDAYLDHQTQQIDRARTFADIRRIEARVSKLAQARPGARWRAGWPFSALAACCWSAAGPRDTEA